MSQVTSLAGKQVTLSITGDEVTLAEAVGGAAGAAAASPQPDNKAATSSKQVRLCWLMLAVGSCRSLLVLPAAK